MQQSVLLLLAVFVGSVLSYTEFDNGYYVGVFTGGTSITWQDAADYCVNTVGSSIGSIHSAADNANAIAALEGAGMSDIDGGDISSTAFNNAWIGYNDIDNEGAFEWEDGSADDYTNFRTGEPNNCCGGEDCAHIWGGGTWNDLLCDGVLLGWTVSGFICNSDATPACDNTQDICCTAWGDPHFTTWDSTYFHFMGVGYFDYVAPCTTDDFMPFLITGKQEACNQWAPMACIFEVRVTVDDGNVIVFPQDGTDPTFLSSGASAVGTHTFSDGTYTVAAKSFSGTYKDADTDGDVTISVSYSGFSMKIATSSDCTSGHICGLCGNVNGDSSDDFELSDGTIVDNTGSGTWPVPDDIWDNTHQFGDSWCNEEYTNDPDCVESDPEQPSQDCFDAAEEHCAAVWNSYCAECNEDIDYDEWFEACKFDSCVASGDELQNYDTTSAVNNGFFDSSLDACVFYCEVDSTSFETECYSCADQCTLLTSQNGCANDQCLDTCRDCVSGIDWDDFTGGQSNTCQCHNNGCDQCEDGWFKLDFDFPCQSCSGLIGCSGCTDFWGCQQCDEGYYLSEHDTCGEDSLLNTGNVKFHYCLPNDGTGVCTVGGDDDSGDGGGCPDVVECDSNPCDCSTDGDCDDCQAWGCASCASGYYKKSLGHECASCADNFGGNCNTCTDYSGCTDCGNGFTVTWDNDCGTNICA